MPNENTPTDPTKVEAHNKEVAQKLAAQDISGQSTATGEFGEAVDALDKLAAQVQPKPDETPKPDDALPPKPDETPKPDDALPPKPDTIKKPDNAPPPPDDAITKRADEFFKDSPKLPANASPKSAEAFSAIKQRAAQEISRLEQQLTEAQKKLEESGKPTPETLAKEKELEEHRQWRAKIDVEFDPKFKKYDSDIEQHREFIYAQLSKSPAIPAEVIEQIKKYGGPDKVKIEKILESVEDPTIKRIVEAKIANIEELKYQKEQAIKAAKENVSQYVKERQETSTKEAAAHAQAVETGVTGLLKQLPWFAEKKVDDKADAAAKAEAEAHNTFLTDLQAQIKTALTDNSPEMRSILITGMAQLFYLQKRVPVLEETLSKTIKERDEIRTRWEAVKKSSQSRLSESAAPAAGLPPAKPAVNVNTRAGDALDEIARQVMEKRAAASAGQ